MLGLSLVRGRLARRLRHARTSRRLLSWRKRMTHIVRKTALALGFLVLEPFALPLIGCDSPGSDSAGGALDSGLLQGGNNTSTGTGGAAGASGASGTSTGGQTGHWCSAGGGASGSTNSDAAAAPLTCYPYAYGSFYCAPHLCGCSYNPVTGCLCADDNVSPCRPLDPNCTESTAGGTSGIGLGTGTVNPSKNVDCYCDLNGYWWCAQ
jgi:hypothetical protein